MKTQGEMEAAICAGINGFELEYLGRGAKDVNVHLMGDMLVIRLTGVMTAAEQHLGQSRHTERGQDLVKQVRTLLVETARPMLDAMIQGITGVNVLSLHHDICTVTGEEIFVATLARAPIYRDTKRRWTE